MQKKNKKLAVYTLTAVHLLKMCHSQGWVSAGRNLFLPDMRFKPVSTGKNLEAAIVPVRIVQNVALTQYTFPWCLSIIL